MRNKLLSNILSSGFEKLLLISSQLLSSIIIIRNLSRDDYGIIGIVAGYFSLILLVNLAIEPILLRDHKKFSNINKLIFNFTVFNIIKISVLTVFTMGLVLLLVSRYENIEFIYSIASILLLTSLDTLVSPLIVYASTQYKQYIVTRVSMVRVILNVILLLGLFYVPTLKYIFFKDAIVSVVTLSLWILFSSKNLNISFAGISYKDIDFSYIKSVIVNYSLWTHLNSVATNIIYRIDSVFLSLFLSTSEVGNYNIALNSANVANIIPGVLGYQNKVAISHIDDIDETYKMSNMFVRISLYVGLFTILSFYLFGEIYLYVLTGNETNHEIYIYMLYIVISLVIVKSFASPFMSYIAIKHSVKELFIKAVAPTLIISLVAFYLSSMFFGAIGVAISNILVAVIWLILVLNILNKHRYKFRTILNINKDVNYVRDNLFAFFR